MTGQRSDARRNYAHILAVAEAEVAAQGAQASLERIARVAGVGSATVRRHFPTRKALLDAVFKQRVHVLCERARTLQDEHDSRTALVEWLRELLAYSLAARGLADVLSYEPLQDEVTQDSCGAVIGAMAPPAQQGRRRPGRPGGHHRRRPAHPDRRDRPGHRELHRPEGAGGARLPDRRRGPRRHRRLSVHRPAVTGAR